MPDQTGLEKRFRQWIMDGVPELRRKGYNPTYFLRMVSERGAAQAVRDLVETNTPSEGFTRLWEMKELRVSAEAIVAFDPEWRDLFTDDQRRQAIKRLADYEYQPALDALVREPRP